MSSANSSAASNAYLLRKNLQNDLLGSQKHEHNFYVKVAKKVEAGVTELSRVMSDLLQIEILEWNEVKLRAFSTSSGIKFDLLMNWKQEVASMQNTNLIMQRALKLRGEYKSELNQYSGTLWGAKDGFEAPYNKFKNLLNNANNELDSIANVLKACTITTQNTGAILLDLLIKNSVKLSQCSKFGVTIKALLMEISQDAAIASDAFNREQLRQISDMSAKLSELTKLYGGT